MVITQEDRQMRLPWWGVLCVIVGALLLGLFLYISGKIRGQTELTPIPPPNPGNRRPKAPQYLRSAHQHLIACPDGTPAARGDRRRCASCYPARQRPASDLRRRPRPHRLSRAVTPALRTLPPLSAGLLPHVNHVHLIVITARRTFAGPGPQAYSRTLCRLLECAPVFERTRVARAVLFLSAGRFSSLDRAALRGDESGAGRHGSGGCAMEVVERRGTLRCLFGCSPAGDGPLAKTMDGGRVETILPPENRRPKSRRCGSSPTPAGRWGAPPSLPGWNNPLCGCSPRASEAAVGSPPLTLTNSQSNLSRSRIGVSSVSRFIRSFVHTKELRERLYLLPY